MSSVTNSREEQLNKLDTFLNDSKKKLSSIVSTLGWSIESISEDVEKMVVCPFNQSHHILERSAVKHFEDCQWKAEGYGKEDLPLSIPSLPSGTLQSIKFDEELQDDVIQRAKQRNPTMAIGGWGRLIPRTSDKFTSEFTREERLAMYEHVIANTSQPDIGEDITDMNKPKTSGDGKTSSYLELLAQERNLKRRRTKYRGVHTNKKSQIEILREVISQQMEMLAEYISEKNDDGSHEDANFSRVIDKSDSNRSVDRSSKSERHGTEKILDVDGNGNQSEERTSETLVDSRSHRRSFNDRRYGRESHEFHDKNDFSKDRIKESNDHSRKRRSRRDSSEIPTSRRSSHNSHGHRSKDRHKRHRSRDREKSHSSRGPKHADRSSKKPRRSRDR